MQRIKNIGLFLTLAFLTSAQAWAAFSRVSPTDVFLDLKVLEQIKSDAEKNQTDTLIILRNGKLAYEYHSGKNEEPYDLKSATKSIVSLAIGFLLADKKIRSVDEPASNYLSEWKNNSKKSKITIKDLLGHTSGIQVGKMGGEIDTSPDVVKQALEAPLADAPQTRFFYNNKAVNLIPEIVKRASGQSLDSYLAKKLFRPLGIRKVHWQKDQKENIAGHGGLGLSGIDLAKIGQTLLDDGRWQNKAIIPGSWVASMMVPASKLNPSCGLLWWLVLENSKSVWPPELLRQYREAGFKEDLLGVLKKLHGTTIDWRDPKSKERFGPNETAIIDEIEDRHLEGLDQIPSPAVGYYANGWLGQILLVLPKQKMVIVRQSRYSAMPIINNSLKLAK